jgi:ATP-binding cassette, subfamily B, bacterial
MSDAAIGSWAAPHAPDETTTLLRYTTRPLAFLLRYVRRHPLAHGVVLLSVLAAVGCSVGTHYALKSLVDTLSAGPGGAAWTAFVVLALVLAADNLLWRVGGWIAAGTFPAVTADLRGDLFRHLGGHAPAFFAGRSAGVLASRVTAMANAAYTILHNAT